MTMNRLSKERSPYLRHAADQPIDWFPWCDEAFERARTEGKPVFLSSGGVWCHWCHVMAKETFADPEVAAVLNEQFISIKLDRDERPDIDRRYQQAVALMGQSGGWPLSVFLTHDRKPFFGGTYFPPDDRYGRPGFRKVLRSVADFYRARNADADQYGDRVMAAVRPEREEPGSLAEAALVAAQAAMLALFDAEHGGFGSQPKFPMPGVLEFLLSRSVTAADPAAGDAARATLDAMAAGGFHDQLAGGFHRYSVDEGWQVPHFEKMADDNAWLLRNYLDAYALFGEEGHRSAAEGIIRFLREVLSDPAGGFYASQDADVSPDDEGGYFTWSDRELHDVLTIEEYEVLSRRFLHERGRMHGGDGRRVLSRAMQPREIAAALGMTEEHVGSIVQRGAMKLLAARGKREAPFIDRTVYTSLNGMCITSFLKAAGVLEEVRLREFALASLDRVMRERFRDGSLEHSEGIPGMLDDHASLIEAFVAAYEATGRRPFLDQASELMDICLRSFGDPGGGFFDTDRDVLGMRLKRVEDVPHPSANAVAIKQLIKLRHITGRTEYGEAAERSLRAFVPAAAGMSIHAGMYYSSLQAWFSMRKLTVEAPPESPLALAARKFAGPHDVLVYGEDRGRIVPCVKEMCFEPIVRPEDFRRLSGR